MGRNKSKDWKLHWIVHICTRPYACLFPFVGRCDMIHPFPHLVYIEAVRWTQGAKGRKSDNMADYISDYISVHSDMCEVFLVVSDFLF